MGFWEKLKGRAGDLLQQGQGPRATAPAEHGVPSEPPGSGEPCPLERFAEIMAAQGVWAEQGRDVRALLLQTFAITALDWSNMGAYWNVRIGSDHRLGVKLGELMDRFRRRYVEVSEHALP